MFSRAYNQALEAKITKAMRSIAEDEAKARGSNKTRKVQAFKFKDRFARRFDLTDLSK